MGKPTCFSNIYTKGNNFCDFAPLADRDQPRGKSGSLLNLTVFSLF